MPLQERLLEFLYSTRQKSPRVDVGVACGGLLLLKYLLNIGTGQSTQSCSAVGERDDWRR